MFSHLHISVVLKFPPSFSPLLTFCSSKDTWMKEPRRCLLKRAIAPPEKTPFLRFYAFFTLDSIVWFFSSQVFKRSLLPPSKCLRAITHTYQGLSGFMYLLHRRGKAVIEWDMSLYLRKYETAEKMWCLCHSKMLPSGRQSTIEHRKYEGETAYLLYYECDIWKSINRLSKNINIYPPKAL